MGNFSDNAFGQIHDGFVVEGIEEADIEQWTVGLFSILGLHVFGEGVDDFFVLFELKLLFDEVRLFNEVVDFGLEFFGDFVLVAHPVKVFEFFLFLFVFCLNFADDRPDAVDVVGKRNTADSLNEDESDSFCKVGGRNISESDSEHDVGAPIIAPNIFSFPVLTLNVDFVVPVDSLCA